METPVAPPDPALDALAETRGPLRRMALLATVGLVFWLGLLGWLAWKLNLGLSTGPALAGKLFAWSIVGLPVLLHLWPILRLRAASRELAAFADEPSDDTAAAALRAQRGYWRAAAISHAVIVAWFAVVVASLAASPMVSREERIPLEAEEEAADHGSR